MDNNSHLENEDPYAGMTEDERDDAISTRLTNNILEIQATAFANIRKEFAEQEAKSKLSKRKQRKLGYPLDAPFPPRGHKGE